MCVCRDVCWLLLMHVTCSVYKYASVRVYDVFMIRTWYTTLDDGPVHAPLQKSRRAPLPLARLVVVVPTYNPS